MTVLALKLASALNLDDKLKNEILVAFRFFAFSHSQGHFRKLPLVTEMSIRPSGADILGPSPQYQ